MSCSFIQPATFCATERPNVAGPPSVDWDANSHDSDINRRTKLLMSCTFDYWSTSIDKQNCWPVDVVWVRVQCHTTATSKCQKKLNNLGMCLYFVLQSSTLVANKCKCDARFERKRLITIERIHCCWCIHLFLVLKWIIAGGALVQTNRVITCLSCPPNTAVLLYHIL